MTEKIYDVIWFGVAIFCAFGTGSKNLSELGAE